MTIMSHLLLLFDNFFSFRGKIAITWCNSDAEKNLNILIMIIIVVTDGMT